MRISPVSKAAQSWTTRGIQKYFKANLQSKNLIVILMSQRMKTQQGIFPADVVHHLGCMLLLASNTSFPLVMPVHVLRHAYHEKGARERQSMDIPTPRPP